MFFFLFHLNYLQLIQPLENECSLLGVNQPSYWHLCIVSVTCRIFKDFPQHSSNMTVSERGRLHTHALIYAASIFSRWRYKSMGVNLLVWSFLRVNSFISPPFNFRYTKGFGCVVLCGSWSRMHGVHYVRKQASCDHLTNENSPQCSLCSHVRPVSCTVQQRISQAQQDRSYLRNTTSLWHKNSDVLLDVTSLLGK